MSKKVCKFLVFMVGVLAVAGGIYYFWKCKKESCCEEDSSDFDDFDDFDSVTSARSYVDLTDETDAETDSTEE